MTACLLQSNSIWGNGSDGGGARYPVARQCVFANNSANRGSGGAAAQGHLLGCLVISNRASFAGGTDGSTLSSCTVVGNSADQVGGVRGIGADNSIIYYNFETHSSNNPNYSLGGYYSCCTTPAPSGGSGTITNEPAFVDPPNGNFRLQSNSPCINAGINAYAILFGMGSDLDGAPRIAGGTVDVGAYEFQSPASIISYAWLQQYSLPTDGTADYTDTDGDHMNNWQEWRAGTVPKDPLSVLKIVAVTPDVSSTTVSWQSVNGVLYYLERNSLVSGAPFSTVRSNLVGQADASSFVDTNAHRPGAFVYRVGVQ
jgi:hypothetical protein